ncbi:MAG: hypothetical protein CVU84_17320 [Firmicutes bacterium HGW-Firmicutes-1]|jgi:hypothetical protein|nr:MAG: hypothetical protein CVU84_17320 [Firmicutes bacterium HGW-Firmicutes-1]
MRFTLVFENKQEGIGASYDLLFAPCPIWDAAGNHILNLNPQDPYLNSGCVKRLIEQEHLQGVEKCVLIIHSIGHGDDKSLKTLRADLDALDIKYSIVDFQELNNG